MIVPPIGYYEKRWGGGQFTKSGLPDLHVVVKGTSVEAEIKGIDGKPSELQLFNLNLINNAGCIGFVLIPTKGIEKVRNYILKNYPEYADIRICDFEKFKELIEWLKS